VTLFFVSAAASMLLSTHPAHSVARSAYAPIALLLFLAAQDVLRSAAAYRRMVMVLGGVVVLLGVDGTYQFWTGTSLLGGNTLDRRVAGSLPNPNDLALIPILLPVALTGLPIWPGPIGLALLAGIPFALATTILSGSRNAWLGLVVGLGLLAALGRHRRLALGVLTLAGVLAGVALVPGASNVHKRAWKLLEVSRDPRIGHWLVAWQMFRESPFLGKGVHTFLEFYPGYLDKVALPSDYAPEVAPIPWPHNLYLEILAERGLAGALAFGVCLFAMGRRLAEFRAQGAGPDARALAAGLTASLASFLVQAWFDLTFLKDWVLLLFLLFVALVARLPVLGPRWPTTVAGAGRESAA
jgi:O-antigen ligase